MSVLTKAAGCVASAAVVLLLPLGALPGSAGAAIVPPQNPAGNISPAPGYSGPCGSLAAPNPYCPSGLTTLYGDRQVEGLGPMSLPSNYPSLTPPEQLFVLTDLERVDRGLAPIPGLAANLDAYAQAGADAHTDPGFPSSISGGGSTYSSSPSLGESLALWMYDDGPGGSNSACPATGGGSCWGHRDIILGSYASPALMGVGYGPSTTELFVGGDTRDTPYFTWAQEVPLLPIGIYPYGVNDSVLPGGSQTSNIGLWASGEGMNLTLVQSGGQGVFSLSTTACDLPAGGSCNVSVSFTPPGIGLYTATLAVTGPNGTQDVPLRGVESHGYRLVASDGGIFSFGDAAFYGSTGGKRLNQPVVGMAPTHDGGGYWMVASDGGIFNYGDAGFYGSMGGKPLNAPIVGMAATPDDKGYWEVASDGGIFSFGDAHFYGSRGGQHLNAPIVGMASDATGHGYWLVASDGGIFNYGDAGFHGSAGSLPLTRPVVGMTATSDGGGYWLVASDGGIFTYGDAGFYGSMGGQILASPVVGIAATPDGGGYWLIASDGGIFNFGDAGFFGSMGGRALVQPVVGGSAQT
ncbi:MAG: hypothetical protein WAL61_02520 [Acidimicrobiales bacterium]